MATPNRIPPFPSAPPAKRPGTAAAIAAMMAAVLAVEGGYVNNRNDPGGETNMGVTKGVAVQHGYTGPMRTIPREVVTSIYYRDYLVAPGYEPLIPLDAAVTSELFDTTVNMGAVRPSRWFQQSLDSLCASGRPVTGHVVAGDVAAFKSCQARLGPAHLCVAMLDSLDGKQRAEYDRLVRVNPRLQGFHKGWIAHRIGNVDRRKCGKDS